jgi:hypothetical protein
MTSGNVVGSSSLLLLRSLCRANDGLLRQKLGLLEAMVTSHGTVRASALFRTPSPVVGGATVGQHYRHALDHVGHAVSAAKAAKELRQEPSSAIKDPLLQPPPIVLPYDRRERGGPDEADLALAKERILRIQQDVRSLQLGADEDADGDETSRGVPETPVVAEFMLSGDSAQEYPLPSTVARELGFGVHHAIHHMAMVRVLVLNEGWLSEDQLDPTFGRAPSTVNYDRTGGS